MKSHAIAAGIILGIIASYFLVQYLYQDTELLSPLPDQVEAVTITPTPTFHPTEQKKDNFIPRAMIEGKASYYTEAGCLGCNPALTMKNGERLSDDKLTIAVTPSDWKKYGLKNKKVKITNQSSGKSTVARVTDTGGFAKYKRVADVSLAVKRAIELKTDVDTITIEVMD